MSRDLDDHGDGPTSRGERCRGDAGYGRMGGGNGGMVMWDLGLGIEGIFFCWWVGWGGFDVCTYVGDLEFGLGWVWTRR